MMRMMEKRSLVSGDQFRVTVDVYGLNPLAADYQQVNPENYRVSVAESGPPPKMFSGGGLDLPAFTASGLEPRLLLQLPYTARHAVAAMPGLPQVHRIFEDYGDDPDLLIPHPGLNAAIVRVRNWAAGRPFDLYGGLDEVLR